MVRIIRVVFFCLAVGAISGGLLGVAKANGPVIEQWVARHDNIESGYYLINAIAVDSSGNTYVVGYSTSTGTNHDFVVIKYDSSGSQVWTSIYDPSPECPSFPGSVVADNKGNVYVTGMTATVKYDSLGKQLWVVRHGESGSCADRRAIALDGSGNLYVTGLSRMNSANENYMTEKYNTNGTLVWRAQYDGPSGGLDRANAIAVDRSGNSYVTGYSEGIGTSRDYVTTKYDPEGGQLWVARYDGPVAGNDGAYAIAVDSLGNCYVTGYSSGIATGSDWATIKYDGQGNQVWSARYSDGDRAYDIRVDGSGNVYVVGTASNRLTLKKYNNEGLELWSKSPNNINPASNYINAYLALDSFGNSYVTEGCYGSGTGVDFVTIRYDNAGNQVWLATYNGPASGNDDPRGIAVDISGNVYITGQSPGNSTDYSYATIKYTQTGVLTLNHTLNMQVKGSGSTQPEVGLHAYPEGSIVNMNANPAPGWEFENWTGSVADSFSSSTTVTVNSDKTVTANFVEVPPDSISTTLSTAYPTLIPDSVTVPISADHQVKTGKLVFFDDFVDNRNKWELDSVNNQSYLGNGELHLVSNTPDQGKRSVSVAAPILDGYAFQAQTTKIGGSDDHLYGLIFGFQNSQNYYVFGITGDGLYRLYRLKDGQWDYLTPYTSSSSINVGNSTNTLTIFSRDTSVELHVNGQYLQTVTLDSNTSGNIGVRTSITDLHVGFDHVRVYSLTSSVPILYISISSVGGLVLVGVSIGYVWRTRKYARLVKRYKQELDMWEEEGYDISEFKERWLR
jgi:hypothetical protein